MNLLEQETVQETRVPIYAARIAAGRDWLTNRPLNKQELAELNGNKQDIEYDPFFENEVPEIDLN